MGRRIPPGRRADILGAARDEFAARGYAAARLDDVAARAGVSRPALYLQFDDKAALFRGVIDWLIDSNLPTALPPEIAGLAATVQLRTMIWRVMTRLASDELHFLPRLVIGESGNFPDIARAWHDRAIGRVLGAIEAIVARGVDDGEFRGLDPALAARSIAGGIVFAALWRAVLEPAGAETLDIEAFAASHAEVILGGLAKHGQGE